MSQRFLHSAPDTKVMNKILFVQLTYSIITINQFSRDKKQIFNTPSCFVAIPNLILASTIPTLHLILIPNINGYLTGLLEDHCKNVSANKILQFSTFFPQMLIQCISPITFPFKLQQCLSGTLKQVLMSDANQHNMSNCTRTPKHYTHK